VSLRFCRVCACAPVLLCSCAPVLFCSSAPVLLCSCAPALFCSSAPVLLCSCGCCTYLAAGNILDSTSTSLRARSICPWCWRNSRRRASLERVSARRRGQGQ
jgi:hypothetical protein